MAETLARPTLARPTLAGPVLAAPTLAGSTTLAAPTLAPAALAAPVLAKTPTLLQAPSSLVPALKLGEGLQLRRSPFAGNFATPGRGGPHDPNLWIVRRKRRDADGPYWYLPLVEYIEAIPQDGLDEYDNLVPQGMWLDFTELNKEWRRQADGEEKPKKSAVACIAVGIGHPDHACEGSDVAADATHQYWDVLVKGARAFRDLIAENYLHRLLAVLDAPSLMEIIDWTGGLEQDGMFTSGALLDWLISKLSEESHRTAALDFLTWALPRRLVDDPQVLAKYRPYLLCHQLMGERFIRWGEQLTALNNARWVPSRPRQVFVFEGLHPEEKRVYMVDGRRTNMFELRGHYICSRVEYRSQFELAEDGGYGQELLDPGVIGWRLCFVEPYTPPEKNKKGKK